MHSATAENFIPPDCKCRIRRLSSSGRGRKHLTLLFSLCPSKGHVFLRISLLLLPLPSPSPSPASAHLHRSACLRAFVAFTCCRSGRRVVNLTLTSVSCALSLALRQAHFRDFGSSDAKLIMKATLRCQKNQFVIACFCFRIKKLLEKTFLSFFSLPMSILLEMETRRWSEWARVSSLHLV